MPFSFNAVKLCVVIINEKPWTRAWEVYKALRYEKAARRVVRHQCTRENIQHKYQLAVVSTEGMTVNWPKDSQKLELYINEEGMYELSTVKGKRLQKTLLQCDIPTDSAATYK